MKQLNEAPSTSTYRFRRKPSTATLIHLRDGEVVLYKRGRSRRWQARFKLFDGQWRRVTTKHIGVEYAARVACEAYDEARFRERLGLPQTTRRFGVVAAVTVMELREALAAGTGKCIYVDYAQVIERYLKPSFERHWITAIDAETVQQFEAWRNEKMGRVPKASTMLTSNTTSGNKSRKQTNGCYAIYASSCEA